MTKSLNAGLFLCAVFLVAVLAVTVSAAPPDFTYQGRLLGPDEAPVPDGPYPARFSLWTDPVMGMGTEVWSENQDITTSGGLFSTYLGQISSFFDVFADFASTPLYLQVEVMVGGATHTLEPRMRLASVPYARESSSLSGDVSTEPGLVRLTDPSTDRTIVLVTNPDSASIAIDEPGARRMLVSSSGGAGGSGGQVSLLLSNVCCLGSSGEDGVGLVSDESSNRLAINSKGTSAKREIKVSTSLDSASVLLGADLDGDGVLDGRIDDDCDGVAVHRSSSFFDVFNEMTVDQDCNATGARLAINSKGTSAKREIKLSTALDSATVLVTADLDNDGTADRIHAIHAGEEHIQQRMSFFDVFTEATIDQDCDVTGTLSRWKAGMSGSTTGTIRMQATPDSALSVLDTDSDGDGVPESEISQFLTPTTSSVAINTKGTGADKNRSISSSCDDVAAIHSLATDDDGDGIAEYRAVCTVTDADGDQGSDMRCVADSDDDGVSENEASFGVTPTTSSVAIKTKGTGADANKTATLSAVASSGSYANLACAIDDDGDTVPESEISQVLTPTTSSMAIKTKGTGASNNRSISSTCDDITAVHSLATDSDGDGLADRVVSSSVDDSVGVVSASEGDVQVSLRTRKGWDGLIYGNHKITKGSSRMIDLDSDGNGYFDHGIGVGTDPVHKIDVVGGAYCDGTDWVNASDINSKENFEQVDGVELLNKIAELEITKWNYKGDRNAQHIGPTAQDFQQTFGVGSDGKSISTIDPSGIALAAIKELTRRLEEKDGEIDELKAELAGLKNLIQQVNASH